MTCLPYFTIIVRFREIREKIRRRSTLEIIIIVSFLAGHTSVFFISRS